MDCSLLWVQIPAAMLVSFLWLEDLLTPAANERSEDLRKKRLVFPVDVVSSPSVTVVVGIAVEKC